jgi:hypothetical protein
MTLLRPCTSGDDLLTSGMSDGYVLDTDVLSYLFRRDTRAELFRPYLVNGAELAISFMTVAGLDQWALLRSYGAGRVERMTAFWSSSPSSWWIDNYVESGRISVCKRGAADAPSRQLMHGSLPLRCGLACHC